MKKIIAVALLAVPLTFAQTPAAGQAPADNTTKTKKHSKKHEKKASKTTDSTTAPATK